MLLQWIEICSSPSSVTGHYISFTTICAITLVILFIVMEIVISYLHAQQNSSFWIYFLIYYSFSGLVILITVPFYIIFGNHFRKHLHSVHGSNRDPTLQRLSRKILFLSYAPGFCIVLTFICIGLAAKFTRQNSHVFLIGESLARFAEWITLGVFVFALFTRRENQQGFDSDKEQRSLVNYSEIKAPSSALVSVK
jgi:hypothetical protein